ncbi:hypothetical protein [Allokutzneria oryzae]|uniref:TerD family protein n=1 Tax=Allokutzneria oryzae TaxID=1378989 RepID=A0ABV5ZRR9_9PSEU
MLDKLIIRSTLRVPFTAGPAGDGAAVARQMDAVLLRAGFTASRALLEHVSGLEPGAAMDRAVTVVGAVRELVGDHVEHNAYFRDFPDGVPDTVEFWVDCLRAVVAPGGVDLLPVYGTYQHGYPELVAAHDELIASAKDRVTVVHLGGSLDDEVRALYLELAGSTTPLGEAGLAALAELAPLCLDAGQPEAIPVREHRAVINAVRLTWGRAPLAVDTPTDVLRLACQASGGDVTLRTTTRFRQFRRPERRILLAALDEVVASGPGKLGDIAAYARRWQRLGERLHPHEYADFPHAQDVFAVARGEKTVRSLAGRIEVAFGSGDIARAVELLSGSPGMLLRQLDRVLRSCSPDEAVHVLERLHGVIDRVSGRVLCSVREHLGNRTRTDAVRVFASRARRAWVTADERPPLDADVVERVLAALDAELARRIPVRERVVVDPAVLTVALPLSGKASEDGFGVMPRGSTAPVDGELLRLFTHWRQRAERTDYDLSVLLLDKDFRRAGFVSWTNHHSDGAYYSGDVTSAENGASEFIDVPLAQVSAAYIVPQVNVYAGEGFDAVAESMFGYMTRELAQKGMPFEASTVRTRSAMRGSGRVAVPLVFARGDDGTWSARWAHLYLPGTSWANQVENNGRSTSLLVRGVMRRDYLTVAHLLGLSGAYTLHEAGTRYDGPVTFVGIDRPDGLPEGSEVITLDRLNALIPE